MLTAPHWRFQGVCYEAWTDVEAAFFERHGFAYGSADIEGESSETEVEWCEGSPCDLDPNPDMDDIDWSDDE